MPEYPPPTDEMIKRLQGAIQIRTVSNANYEETDLKPFDDFVEYVGKTYPLLHKSLEFTRVNTYGLVYKWNGTSKKMLPILFTSHYDVVRVEPGTESLWKYPCFSGQVAEGRFWGRGTLDDKSQVIAHMESIEKLLKEDFKPDRDIYFAFGFDEEVGGKQGATNIAKYFHSKGIRFDGVYDEGGFVVQGVIPGVKSPIAVVGVAEKGAANFEISVKSPGGHSSMPPQHTAIGILSSCITKLEAHPRPAVLTSVVRELLENICIEMGLMVKVAVANLFLFEPVIKSILGKNESTNSIIRTTFAATMMKGSEQPNMLPQHATAIVNCRILPTDSAKNAQNYIERVIGATSSDSDCSLKNSSSSASSSSTTITTTTTSSKNATGMSITVRPILAEEPSPVSPTNCKAYERLVNSIGKVFPGVITSPFLVMGGTDGAKYYLVSDNVYRFTPMLVSNRDKETLHSTNESLTLENYSRMIAFFCDMYKTCSSNEEEKDK
eukprot:MONOS_3914.1-p1 / transcript=MONOS_3914.1 / gene=MONOS_3914 / organism=Monocercomonoides_exilis_PA203 / gene_product=peptidase / transcript_product=peptidase / location=Mono_scaffold00097:29380-30858(+) / protein_length=492 / sequence_SO=supercontig / SO=protein_coding / is_pseudo=false